MGMDAKPLEERTVFEVVTPLGIKGVGRRLDLHVTPDFGLGRINQPQPNRFAVGRPYARVRRKHLSAVESMPVTTGNPPRGLAGVPAFGPSPEAVTQNPFHFLERPLGRDVTVVIN